MQKDARLKQQSIKSCMLEEIRISSDSVVERDSGKKILFQKADCLPKQFQN